MEWAKTHTYRNIDEDNRSLNDDNNNNVWNLQSNTQISLLCRSILRYLFYLFKINFWKPIFYYYFCSAVTIQQFFFYIIRMGGFCFGISSFPADWIGFCFFVDVLLFFSKFVLTESRLVSFYLLFLKTKILYAIQLEMNRETRRNLLMFHSRTHMKWHYTLKLCETIRCWFLK